MKYIIAILQPSKLDAVQENLSSIGISGMTVTEVKGYGRQKGKSEIYRGAEYEINFIPKIKIEVAVSNSDVSKAVETIQNASKSGKIGDGKIFVFEMSRAIRVRTGETGDEAL